MTRRQVFFTHRLMGTVAVSPPPLAALVRLGIVKAARPAWLIEAEQREADARDEADTRRCAYGAAVQ